VDKERLLISRDDLSVALTRLRVIDVYGRVWKDVYLDQQFEIKRRTGLRGVTAFVLQPTKD
jgi:hypothetical protein